MQTILTEVKTHAFIEYVKEFRTVGGAEKYPKASDTISDRTGKPFIDPHDNFRIGESGGFLCDRSFTFVDTHLLNVAARHYEKHNVYTLHEVGTYDYRMFLADEEFKRQYGTKAKCKKLVTGEVVDLHITGEMYNMLNYGRMERAEVKSMKADSPNADVKVGFPRFFESHYWRTTINEFCINNAFNLIIGKSRRAGWSYGEAIDTANDANLIQDHQTILAAYDKKYLTDKEGAIAPMIRDQLNFYEQHTPFNRCGIDPLSGDAVGLLKKDLENMIVGFKNKKGLPDGLLSNIQAVSYADNPDVARGKGVAKVKLEEMSKAAGVFTFLDATMAATKVGGFTRGHIRGWGTAGSKGGDWEQFERWFNDPELYEAMPFENVWDKDKRDSICGYFKSRLECFEGFYEGVFCMDADGNSNFDITHKALIADLERVWVKSKGNKQRYISHRAENATCPSEAFSSNIENIFSSPELNEHIKSVEFDTDKQFHRDGVLVRNSDGRLIFKDNHRLTLENANLEPALRIPVHEYIQDYPLRDMSKAHGCIREWYSPYRDRNGIVPKGLYVIDVDPYAMDIDKKELKQYHSLGAIRVRIVNNNIVYGQSDMLVASFTGRPGTMAAFSKIIMELSEYYGNAEVLAETDRGTIVSDFKQAKKLSLLAKEPVAVWDTKATSDSKKYGIVIGNAARKLDGLEYLRESLYAVRGVRENGEPILGLHYELDLMFLKELQKFDGVKNADRISAAIVGEYHSKSLIINKHNVSKAKSNTKTIFDNMDSWFGGTGRSNNNYANFTN